MVTFILILGGCSQPVSISSREVASEFISYFAGKEILDPIFYPNETDEDRKKHRDKLAKEIFNKVWSDFNVRCSRYEKFDVCKKRVIQELHDWTDLYTDNFIELYQQCKIEALHSKYQKYDILTLFKDTEICVIDKNSTYKILFELARKIKN
jgi:hypothetical protein